FLNAYFHGQLLDAEGLELGQRNARYANALLGRLLATGRDGAVLEGLDVEVRPPSKPGDPYLASVSPGVAIDAYGRLIVVPDRSAPAGDGRPSGEATLPIPAQAGSFD